MSKHAVAYVRGLGLTDPNAERVFLLLAERTRTEDEPEPIMGLHLRDADIPGLAARIGIDADEFRRLLRVLKKTVPLDAIAHADGVWEIIYGPMYSDSKARRGVERSIGGVQPFTFPGWDRYSTWGLEQGLGQEGQLYAQLYLNTDDRNAAPRIWITPPTHAVTTVDQLAEVIAKALALYFDPIPIHPEMIKRYLKV